MGKVLSSEFYALLDRAEAKFGQKQKAAKAIGIKPPRYSRLRHGTDPYGLNIRNCFRLADAIDEAPQTVLRAVGKGELADVLDEFYGESKAPAPTLTRDEIQLLEKYRLTHEKERHRTIENAEVVQRAYPRVVNRKQNELPAHTTPGTARKAHGKRRAEG